MTTIECKKCSYDKETHICNLCGSKDKLCNLCGESMSIEGSIYDENHSFGLIDAKVSGEYSSYHLSDYTIYNFSLCEKCLRQLFVQCKIKPDLKIDNEIETFEKDQFEYEYKVWKNEGYHHKAYVNGKCNYAKDCPNKAMYSHFYNDKFTEDCSCEEHKINMTYILPGYSLRPFISNTLKPFI